MRGERGGWQWGSLLMLKKKRMMMKELVDKQVAA
jgi:hypothetical protein